MQLYIKKKHKMYLLIIFLPLFGAVCSGFFGYYIGYKGSSLITTLCITITFFLSCFSFYEVGLAGSVCYISLFDWINLEIFKISWGFLFDSLTVVMLIVNPTKIKKYAVNYVSIKRETLKFLKCLIITLNIIVGFLILIAFWDSIHIIFSKVRVILILILDSLILSLYFLYFLKKNIEKTIRFWSGLLLILLITLIYLCDLNLSEYFTGGQSSVFYAIITGDGEREIFMGWIEKFRFDPSLFEDIEIQKKK